MGHFPFKTWNIVFASNVFWKKVIFFFLSHRHEAMTDLIYLLGQLVDLKGNILIPGINDKVLPLTDDERATYTDIDFDKVSQQQGRQIYFITSVSLPVRSYQALSNAKRREVCQGTSTDTGVPDQGPSKPLLDSFQIYRGRRNARLATLITRAFMGFH